MWVEHPLFVPPKIFQAGLALEYIIQHGDMTGFFGTSNVRYTEERTCSQFPYLADYWKKNFKDRKNTLGETLVRRGDRGLPSALTTNGNYELRRFLPDDFQSTRLAVVALLDNPTKVLHHEQILHLQEQRIIAKSHGPCVYIRTFPHDLSLVYCGFSGNLAERNHGNSPSYILSEDDFISFVSERTARRVESVTHKYIVELGGYKPQGAKTNGLFRIPKQDAPALVRKFIHDTYGFLSAHNSGSLDS